MPEDNLAVGDLTVAEQFDVRGPAGGTLVLKPDLEGSVDSRAYDPTQGDGQRLEQCQAGRSLQRVVGAGPFHSLDEFGACGLEELRDPITLLALQGVERLESVEQWS